MTRYRLSQEDYVKINASWKRTGSLHEACSMFGIASPTLRKMLARRGDKSPNGSGGKGEMRRKVLAYIVKYRTENGEMPYIAAVGRELGLSRQAAFYHVKRLEASGKLKWGGDDKV